MGHGGTYGIGFLPGSSASQWTDSWFNFGYTFLSVKIVDEATAFCRTTIAGTDVEERALASTQNPFDEPRTRANKEFGLRGDSGVVAWHSLSLPLSLTSS